MHGNLLHPCGGNFLELVNDFGAAASHSEVSNERLGNQRRARRDEAVITFGELLLERRRHFESQDFDIP
jgi:hypothetical protein